MTFLSYWKAQGSQSAVKMKGLRWRAQGVFESGFAKLLDAQPPQYQLRPPVDADLSTDTQGRPLEEFALV